MVKAADGAGSPGDSLDFAAIMAATGEAAFVWDIASDRLRWSPNITDVIGDVGAETLACMAEFSRLTVPGPDPGRADVVARMVLREKGASEAYTLQYELTVPAGAIWIEEIGRWYAGVDGRATCAAGTIRVITERHAREQRLARLSTRDELTGELNRSSLIAALEGAFEDAARFRTSFGFVLIAIDHLSRINETIGHNGADEAIAELARRVHTRLRGGDVIGRFSGNKLALILKDCTREQMEVAATRFLAAVRDEVVVTSAGTVAITASAGGVIAPRHARNAADAMGRAQEALDSARRRRHGHFTSWRPSVEIESRRLRNIRATDEIVQALNDRRIEIAFEPVADAVSLKTAFYESLLRIRRPDGELMAAQEVVPIAEKLGLIRLLDHEVLRHVVAELAAAPGLVLSVNISPETTTDPGWWSALDDLLRVNSGVAERLIIEITETVAIQDIDDVRGFVARLKNLGSRIAIDDFGAGFTSFRNLRKLGVDIVKIDGEFIRTMLNSADDRAFTHTMIDLAHRLGLETVAEWVQDEASAALLRGWGCTYIQGHLTGLASLERPWRVRQQSLKVGAA
jgi:diguanylate cyclase (GGDEF)-like protein